MKNFMGLVWSKNSSSLATSKKLTFFNGDEWIEGIGMICACLGLKESALSPPPSEDGRFNLQEVLPLYEQQGHPLTGVGRPCPKPFEMGGRRRVGNDGLEDCEEWFDDENWEEDVDSGVMRGIQPSHCLFKLLKRSNLVAPV